MTDPVQVLVTVPISEPLMAQLRSISPRLNLTQARGRSPEEVPNEVWAKTEVLYTARLLPGREQAPNLRWIQFHSSGIDNVINAPILEKEDLIVTTLSGAAASELAEYVLMMLLALGHHLPDLMASQRSAEWPGMLPKDKFERFSPRELRGSTVGIVGYGSIGRQVARLLSPFGARLLATKRDAMHPEDKGFAPEGWGDPEGEYVYRLYPPQALGSMLKECDFVVVCVPLTPATENLIGADEFAVLKPGAYLVDVSRGGVINQPALIHALKDRKLAGAALDVFPQEPLPETSPLWKLSNVILTPHIAGSTPHYDERAVELFSENLRRYLAGLPLYNRVNLERGY